MVHIHKLFEVITFFVNFVIILVYATKINILKRNANNCDLKIGNSIFNLNLLNSKNGYEISVGNKIYVFNICGPAFKCKNPDVASCVIDENNKIYPVGPIGNIYTTKDNFTLIEFKCKRHLKDPNIILQSTGKKRIKFIFETSKVCIKQPLVCKVQQYDNIKYDITSLYNSDSNWIVKNVTNSSQIYLNVCGNLHTDFNIKYNDCLYNGTQVCLVDSQNNYINLGVFSTDLTFNNNGLSVTFTEGSLCENTKTISTRIEFICAFNNSGPILLNYLSCEYIILWYTPTACPFYNLINDNCTIRDTPFGKRSIDLIKPQNREQSIGLTNVKMKYNICGSLNVTCNGRHDVSFCLISKGKEIIFGKKNRTVITWDTDVNMHLFGEKCSYNKNRTVHITFRCDYTPNKPEEIILSKDLCTANVIVFTNTVCLVLNSSETKCQFPLNNTHYYDFSQLRLKDRNYEIIDPEDEKIVYLLNLCQPLIVNSNAICEPGSAVCMRNNSEPNKFRRFISLGNYFKASELQQTNDMFIHYKVGHICQISSNEPEYETVIIFKCVLNSQNITITVSKTGCKYTFIWETQFACPIQNDTDQILKQQIEFENTEKKIDVPKIKNVIERTINMASSTHTTAITVVDKIETETKKETFLPTNKPPSITNKSFTISLYVPNEISNNFGIFINNCTIEDHVNQFKKLNLHGLSNITVYSKSGKLYSVHICVTNTQIFCQSARCLTNINITQSEQFVAVNFKGKRNCNNGSYNFTLFLKCSKESQTPVITKEEECSVHLEWKNAATCAFLKPYEIELHSGSKIAVISVSIIAIIICLAGVAFYYFWWRRRNIRSEPLIMHHIHYRRNV